MNWNLSLSLVLPVVVGVVGWWVGHWLAVRRDQTKARRQWVLENLIAAFRDLESVSNRPETTTDPRVAEKVAREVQLWGTPEQVRMAKDFADTISSSEANTSELLNNLRDHIRQELGMEQVDHLRFLRFDDNQRTPRLEGGGSNELSGAADGT